MDNVFLVGRADIQLNEREMLMLATVEEVMKKARLSFYCPRCYANGFSDGGIRGNNHLNAIAACDGRRIRRATP
jgi:hypothetical protein